MALLNAANAVQMNIFSQNCSNSKQCYYSLIHEAGNKVCIEYKCGLEVLAVQSKSRVSKAQAKLIFQRAIAILYQHITGIKFIFLYERWNKTMLGYPW